MKTSSFSCNIPSHHQEEICLKNYSQKPDKPMTRTRTLLPNPSIYFKVPLTSHYANGNCSKFPGSSIV